MIYGEYVIDKFCRNNGCRFNRHQIHEIFIHSHRICQPLSSNGIIDTIQDLSDSGKFDWLRGIDYHEWRRNLRNPMIPGRIDEARPVPFDNGESLKDHDNGLSADRWIIDELITQAECQHEWVDYIGFTKAYRYCKKCDEKDGHEY